MGILITSYILSHLFYLFAVLYLCLSSSPFLPLPLPPQGGDDGIAVKFDAADVGVHFGRGGGLGLGLACEFPYGYEGTTQYRLSIFNRCRRSLYVCVTDLYFVPPGNPPPRKHMGQTVAGGAFFGVPSGIGPRSEMPNASTVEVSVCAYT